MNLHPRTLHRWIYLLIFAASGLALHAGAPVLTPVERPVPVLPDGVYEVAAVDQPPQAREMTRPVYPRDLASYSIEGHALVIFVIGTNGRVSDVTVLKATDIRFGEEAVNAIQQWRFRPAKIDGKPVKCRLTLPLAFEVRG